MPLEWKVDHDAQLVVTTVIGKVGRQDRAEYFAAAGERDARGYRVIFDMRAADVSLRPGDLAGFSQVVGGRRDDAVSNGRIALIVRSEAERAMADYFAVRTEGQRPCRLFRNFEEAMMWLDERPPSRSSD